MTQALIGFGNSIGTYDQFSDKQPLGSTRAFANERLLLSAQEILQPRRMPPPSPRPEQALDLVEDDVQQAAGRLAAGEVEGPAVPGHLSADGQAVAGF